MKEKSPSALADITLSVRDLKSRLDDLITERVNDATSTTGYVNQFDATLPTEWVSVRKDVTYTPSDVRLDRDRLVLAVRVKVRGRVYVGVAEHRLPVVASVQNAPRFAWSITPLVEAKKIGQYDKLVPPVAGQLVLDDLASRWAGMVDESVERVVDHLRAEAVALVRATADLAPLIEARDLIRDAWQVLRK